ncbi:GntR family transcriptional regulator [Clostridium cavendishii DSM 21758]|uniref:GntR family transcriptional regulator n=1 Tax=Clostridium cavendishii DSM 21758 TaxID=1121302 RepID=A0A1M6EDI4_9CLOT|nr:GntR family transcriptional regulator [Clostridium cavendishii]SHI83388.1 GntR family transcriptional regulator [Clostridium cavendishii DSM 21758]
MDIIISNSSGVAIYEQIVRQIETQIISGDLKEGEPLPSIRNLAQQLRISVITTKRAYEELERSGFIETVKGKGSFVAIKNKDMIREMRMKKVEEYITKAIDEGKSIGLSKEEIKEFVDVIYEEF